MDGHFLRNKRYEEVKVKATSPHPIQIPDKLFQTNLQNLWMEGVSTSDPDSRQIISDPDSRQITPEEPAELLCGRSLYSVVNILRTCP